MDNKIPATTSSFQGRKKLSSRSATSAAIFLTFPKRMTMAGFVTGASLGLRGAPSRSSICGRRPLSCAGVMMMADGEDGGDNGKKGGGMKNPFAALGGT